MLLQEIGKNNIFQIIEVRFLPHKISIVCCQFIQEGSEHLLIFPPQNIFYITVKVAVPVFLQYGGKSADNQGFLPLQVNPELILHIGIESFKILIR